MNNPEKSNNQNGLPSCVYNMLKIAGLVLLLFVVIRCLSSNNNLNPFVGGGATTLPNGNFTLGLESVSDLALSPLPTFK